MTSHRFPRMASGSRAGIFPIRTNREWSSCHFSVAHPQRFSSCPTPVGAIFHWTPDGRAVSFLNRVNGAVNVWEQPVLGGAPKAVTHFTSGDIFYFDWYRDGTLALSRGTELIDAVLIRNF